MVTKKKSLVKELRNKTILVTGGAGSVGSALVEKLCDYPVKSIRVLDTDEYGLFKLKKNLKDNRLRLLLGSVLDKERIEMAGNNSDIIIHCAAIKNIEISEFNPIETIEVNINGMVNMIKMAMRSKPEKFLNISTDKAADASTLYGATKYLSEKLVSWAGAHLEYTKFGSVRFGNVIESRGNVFEIWKEQARKNLPLSITHPKMRRYFFHIDEAVGFILECLTAVNEGEVFIPKMKLYEIKKLAIGYSKKHRVTGLRQGEKMEEILLTDAEKKNAVEKSNMWVLKPYRYLPS